MKIKREYKPKPSINGTLECPKGHQWVAGTLNPERVVVQCPVCAFPTTILKGLQNEQRK